MSPAVFCRICRKFFSNFNQNIPLGEYRPAQAAGHRSGRTTAKAGHARSHFRTALQDQAARCSLHVFTQFPTQQKTHQASNLGELWWLKTDSNHRPAGYELSIFESHYIQISYITIKKTLTRLCHLRNTLYSKGERTASVNIEI